MRYKDIKYPDEWLREYVDYSEENFRNNVGIYDIFNVIQVGKIKEYFRWITRMKVREVCKNTSLEAKPKKAEIFSSIMEGAEDWIYDGCVDTGSMGGGHCDLGHALRYEHYAYSPSLNKDIIFGINCASDFFGIEQSKLKQIMDVQAITLEEIKFIAFIVDTNKIQEYINLFYGDMRQVVTILQDRLEDTFGIEWWNELCIFINNRIPLTKTLLSRYNWVKERYYNERVVEINRINSIRKLLDTKDTGIDEHLLNTIAISDKYYTKLAIHYLGNRRGEFLQQDNNEFSDRVIKAIEGFEEACDILYSCGVKDIVKFATSGEIEVVYMYNPDGEAQLATIEQVKNMSHGTYIKEVRTTSSNNVRLMKGLAWAYGGDGRIAREIFGEGSMNYKDRAEGIKEGKVELGNKDPMIIKGLLAEGLSIVEGVIEWINSEGFREELQLIGKRYRLFTAYKSVEGSADPPTIENVIQYLMENCPRDDQRLHKLALDIIKFSKGDNRRLSNRQKLILRKCYEELAGINEDTEDLMGGMDLEVSEIQVETINKCNYLIRNKQDTAMASRSLQFALRVAGTILNNPSKEASRKQRDIIDKAINEYESILSSAGRKAKIRKEDIQREVEGGDKVSKVDGIQRVNGTGVKFPSLVDLSEGLGIGLFSGRVNI